MIVLAQGVPNKGDFSVSRYGSQSTSLFFSGERASTSTPFSGVGGDGRGGGVSNDEMVVEPLRVVWSKEDAGSSAQSLGLVVFDEGDELSLVLERNDPLGGGLDKGDVSTDPWLNGKFAHFSRCLGMPTEGFKEYILGLMRKMKEKMNQVSKGNCESRQRHLHCLIVS